MGNEWIKPILGKGFAVLLTLRLKNAPTEDMVKPTLETWFQVLTYKQSWEQELDQVRFERAFMWIAQNCDWFPTPKVFLDAMPRREVKELPPPPPKTAEEQAKLDEIAQQNIQKLKRLLRGCYAK
ncbi:hypothetical protein ACWIUH_07715 [Ursidibacter arcticus]